MQLDVTEREPIKQTPNERIIYSITTTNWGTSPASPSVKAYDETNGDTDVTTTVFPTNSPSASGNVVTLSLLRALVQDHNYRIEVQFTSGTNIFECIFRVNCVKYYLIGELNKQSPDEEIYFSILTTNWKSTPTSPSAAAYDESAGDATVTSTVFPTNTPSASGDTINLSALTDLTAGRIYRVTVQFTVSTEIFEPSFRVECPL